MTQATETETQATAPVQGALTPDPDGIWQGGLLLLSSVLQAAARQSPGRWMKRSLPGGETVACRMPAGTQCLEMLLVPGLRATRHELHALERHLGLTGWTSEAVVTKSLGEGRRYQEPRPPIAAPRAEQAPASRTPAAAAHELPPDREAQLERARSSTGG